MGPEYLKKAIACLLSGVGAASVVAGLLSFVGPAVVSINPWLLTIVGFLVFLSGYGMMTADLDEVP